MTVRSESTENEIERKMLISKEKYDETEEILSKSAESSLYRILQINYYYDTDEEDLLNRRETLRVRQKEGKLYLQHKHCITPDNGIRVSLESKKALDRLPTEITINDLTVRCQGVLITERIKRSYGAYTVFLDKNFYLGKVDYEIEIEAVGIDDMPSSFAGIEFGDEADGKYFRFAKALKERKADGYAFSFSVDLPE